MTRERTTPAMERLEELHRSALERRRLLERVERHMIAGDLLLAVDDLLSTVKLLSNAEERVMQLHTECFAMIEHARKALQLVEEQRPIVVKLDDPQSDALRRRPDQEPR